MVSRAWSACLLLLSVAATAQVATQTALTISPSTVVEGQDTKVSVTVTASSGKPSGSVGIYVGTDELLTVTVTNGAGSVTVPAENIPSGTYTVVAKYAGASGYAASQGSASATVLSPVTVALQGIPNPVVAGQTAKLVATLTATDGGGTPTGTVKFVVDGETVGSATASNGQAVLSAPTTGLADGTYPVVAEYSGDATHGAANSPTVDVTLEAPGGTACGTGNEKILSGQYTFSLSGFSSGSQIPYFTIGSFSANGSGGITGGEQDFNSFHATAATTISSVSQYSVGSDGRGCLTLVTSNNVTHVYRFSLSNVGALVSGTAAFGRMIEFDDTNGSGTRATGGFIQASPSQIGLADLQPTYSFGLGGYEQSGSIEHASLFGNFAISTSGAMSKGVTDSNYNGTLELNQSFTGGTLSALDSYGRGILSFTALSEPYTFVVYEINHDHFYVLGNNDSGSVPALDGEMHYAASDFSSSTIWPTWVDHISGAAPNQSSYTQVLALTKFTTSGTYSSTRYTYTGTASTVTDSGTFTVGANGRLVLNSSAGGSPQIYYMFYTANAFFTGEGAYVMGTQSPVATSGASDQQESVSYSDASLAGSYNYGADVMLEGSVKNIAGAVSLSNTGLLTGTVDTSNSAGLDPAVAVDGPTFNFGSNGVSSITDSVSIATGSNIYELQENGSLNAILDLTIN